MNRKVSSKKYQNIFNSNSIVIDVKDYVALFLKIPNAIVVVEI